MPRDPVNFLEHSVMGSIRATPLGNVAARYLDVLFSDAGGTIRVTAEAADLSDRTEAFYLTAEDSGPEPRWVNSEGLEAWPPEDLARKWRSAPEGGLFGSPRIVTFYVDPEDQARPMGMPGPFGGAAAIEFSSPSPGGGSKRVVLYAAPDYPCSVEVATDPPRCDEILGALEPLVRRE
jgi:hypothetical protein